MGTKSVVWSSCSRLSCASAQSPDVVLCVTDSSLLAARPCPISGDETYAYTTMDAVLTKVWKDNNGCGTGAYRYLLSYDDSLLADPTVALTTAQIEGVFCKGCLTSYIDDRAGDEITVVDNEDGTYTVTSQHGCVYTIAASTPAPAWELLGNAGTVDGTNFLGTTDNVPLTLRTNNVQSFRINPANGTLANSAPDIIGGWHENAIVGAGTIGGGNAILSGGYSGQANLIDSTSGIIISESLIGGGLQNKILNTADWCSILGGLQNTISGFENEACVILGGESNTITGTTNGNYADFIGAGDSNTISRSIGGQKENVIVGGSSNSITDADASIIGGGNSNSITATSTHSGNTIPGGENNTITESDDSTIGGGYHSTINVGFGDTIAGGNNNTINGTVGGAASNFIGAGVFNTINNILSGALLTGNVIGGGNGNSILDGDTSFIGGGDANKIKNATGSAILGGANLTIGTHTVGYQNPSQTLAVDVSAFSGFALFSDVDFWIGNTDNTARKLKLFEPNTSRTYSGTNFTSFRAQAQSANIDYVLPAAAGTTNQYLQISGVSGTDVTLTWATIAAAFITAISDTNSVDLTVTGTTLSADSKISATSGNQISIAGDGLLVPKAAGLAITDTNSVDLTLTSGTLSADSKISATSGNAISIAGDGLLVNKAAGLTKSDTSSIAITLTSGNISAASKISATGGNTITVNADGLYSAGGTGFINSITDTATVDLTVTGTALSADVKVSADAGNIISAHADGVYAAASGGMAIGGTVTSGTSGSVLYVGAGPVLAQDNSNHFWDATNHRLGLGTTSPLSTLDSAKSFGANIVTKTSTYTVTESDFTILCDATSGAMTINLPAVAGVSRRIYNIKKIDSSANAVTIDGNASETIDGATTVVISSQYQSYTIQCNGSAWYIL